MEFSHIPVMGQECMELLELGKHAGGIFIDGTLGGGGHSEMILQGSDASVIGIDRDSEAIAAASKRLSPYGQRFRALHGNFADIKSLLGETDVSKADGVLLDLGVSSHQLDTPERGFSFHNDAPLDMRMDKTQSLTAKTVLNSYPQERLIKIISGYGEEKWAVRIAKFIVDRRPLETTGDLVAAIDAAIPKAVRREAGHPARRTFQAIRIEVNGELLSLERGLQDACSILKPGGRLVVISFHSLEDRIVKQAFQTMQNPCTCPPGIPVCICGKKPLGKIITRKPVLPGEEEEQQNLRSRSAKVRAFERNNTDIR